MWNIVTCREEGVTIVLLVRGEWWYVECIGVMNRYYSQCD